MHEINSVNKRLRTIKNFSNYIIAGIVVTTLSAIIVMAANGYDFDATTGQVIQNGILLVETEPEGATVSINGQPESARTPAKYPIPAGRYNLRIEKKGYRPWQSDVEVLGSRVNWIYYPRLVPDVIETETVFATAGLSIYEHNRASDAILLAPASNLRRLTLFDLGANVVEAEPILLSDELFVERNNRVVGDLEFIDWSDSGRYVVLLYTQDTRSDYLVIDLANPTSTYNLDNLFETEFDDVRFIGNSEDIALLNDGDVFSVRPKSSALGNPVATDVDELIVGPEMWVARNSNNGKELSLLSRPLEVALTVDDNRADVLIGSWEGSSTVVVRSDDLVSVYRSPEESDAEVVDKILKLSDAQSVSLSPSGRIVAVHGAQTTLVYDIEWLITSEVAFGADDNITWMADYHFAASRNGSLIMVDFDGANEEQIASYDARFLPVTDNDFSAIYSIDKSSASNQLLLHESALSID